MKNTIENLLHEKIGRTMSFYAENDCNEEKKHVWTESEIISYDMGYIRGLQVAINILKEQGE